MDAASWIAGSPFPVDKKDWKDFNIFFKLADEGYDVWMGNNRATRYSNENYRYLDANKIRGNDYMYPE